MKKNRIYEHSLVTKLQKEIKEEKDNAIKKRMKELTECRQLIKDNELAKAKVIERKNKEKEDDAAALVRYEKLLNDQDDKRKLEMQQRENRIIARMNKMKQTVIDKQDKQHLKLLKQTHDTEAARLATDSHGMSVCLASCQLVACQRDACLMLAN